jgi:hypothetical protein
MLAEWDARSAKYSQLLAIVQRRASDLRQKLKQMLANPSCERDQVPAESSSRTKWMFEAGCRGNGRTMYKIFDDSNSVTPGVASWLSGGM